MLRFFRRPTAPVPVPVQPDQFRGYDAILPNSITCRQTGTRCNRTSWTWLLDRFGNRTGVKADYRSITLGHQITLTRIGMTTLVGSDYRGLYFRRTDGGV